MSLRKPARGYALFGIVLVLPHQHLWTYSKCIKEKLRNPVSHLPLLNPRDITVRDQTEQASIYTEYWIGIGILPVDQKSYCSGPLTERIELLREESVIPCVMSWSQRREIHVPPWRLSLLFDDAIVLAFVSFRASSVGFLTYNSIQYNGSALDMESGFGGRTALLPTGSTSTYRGWRALFTGKRWHALLLWVRDLSAPRPPLWHSSNRSPRRWSFPEV